MLGPHSGTAFKQQLRNADGGENEGLLLHPKVVAHLECLLSAVNSIQMTWSVVPEKRVVFQHNKTCAKDKKFWRKVWLLNTCTGTCSKPKSSNLSGVKIFMCFVDVFVTSIL